MKLLGVAIAVAACASPVLPPPQPALAPGLRVEGAPPIDRALLAAHERAAVRGAARVLDISDDGARVLALVGGALVELAADGAATPVAGLPARRAVVSAQYGRHGGVLALADEDGDERATLFAIDRAGVRELASDVHAFVRDGDRICYATTAANGEEVALWLAGDGPPRFLYAATALVPLALAGDRLLAKAELTPSQSRLIQVEVATGMAKLMSLGPAVPAALFGSAGEIYALTYRYSDRLGIERIVDGRRQRAVELGGSSDVTALVRAGGGFVYVLANEAGVSSLHHVDASGADRWLAKAPRGGVISDLRAAANASAIAFTFTGPGQPRGAYTLDLVTGRTTALALPPHRSDAVDPVRTRIAPALSALVYRPALAPGAKAPVVVELHGGPEERFLPRYSAFAQFLVGRGYVVIQPDVRGSSGHGRSFAARDDGLHREDALVDVVATLAYVAAQPELDAKRIAVVGTSYGGFLALAATLAYPERIRGCATVGAIADLPGFLAGTAPWRREGRRAEYGDERDPGVRAFLERLSPITGIAKLRRPLLVAHGMRDPRVPFTTARRLVDEARATGTPVWSLFAADEGHWFERAENRRSYEVLVAQFLASVFSASR